MQISLFWWRSWSLCRAQRSWCLCHAQLWWMVMVSVPCTALFDHQGICAMCSIQVNKNSTVLAGVLNHQPLGWKSWLLSTRPMGPMRIQPAAVTIKNPYKLHYYKCNDVSDVVTQCTQYLSSWVKSMLCLPNSCYSNHMSTEVNVTHIMLHYQHMTIFLYIIASFENSLH